MLQNALDDQLLTRVLFLSCLPLCIIASQLQSRHIRDVFQDLQVDFLVRRHLWLQFNSTGIQSLSLNVWSAATAPPVASGIYSSFQSFGIKFVVKIQSKTDLQAPGCSFIPDVN